MKKILYIACFALFLGCDSEKAGDCFQASGTIVEEEFVVRAFNAIQVWERVQLIISQGDIQAVWVETGENLLNEIQVKVEDSILKISNRNSCNYVRDYGVTKVFVTIPRDNITIINSSGHTVENRGPLRFKEMSLISEDPENTDLYHHDGDFRLDELDLENLSIQANGLSRFYLSGKVGFGIFSLYDGDVRVEAEGLEILTLQLFHRSTNKMIVNPQRAIRGIITGLGDVIAKNRPPIVEVEEIFTGKLIFE